MIVGKDGTIKDMYMRDSTRDLLGDDFQQYYYGIYLGLSTSSNIFTATSSSKSYDYIQFNNSDASWKYTFYDDRMETFVSVKSKYPGFFFTPNMDNMLLLSQRNLSAPENSTLNTTMNITARNVSSQAWPEAIYTTFGNAKITLYLNNHPIMHGVATEGQVNYYDGNLLWDVSNLESIYGGMPMEQGYSYKIMMLFNLSTYTPEARGVNMMGGPQSGQPYTIYTNNYTAKINLNCVLTDLRLVSSINNILGYGNYSGLFLSTQSPDSGILTATSMYASNDTIYCSNNLLNWTYKFRNDEIVLTMINTNATWLKMYAAINQNTVNFAKDISSSGSSDSMNLSNGSSLVNKNWTKTEFWTVENGRVQFYMMLDHDIGLAAAETPVYIGSGGAGNGTLMYSVDTLYSGFPMAKGNYYSVKIKFNNTLYHPSTLSEISYPRSYAGENGAGGGGNGGITRAIVKVNNNFTSANPSVSMPLVVALHPINMTIDAFVAQTGIDTEVAKRNWTLIVPEVYGRNSSPGNHSMYDIGTDELSSDVIDAIN